MSATLCVFLLTFLTRCGSEVVSGRLGPPTNVRLTSYNMDLVLRWDPPVEGASGLAYTAEYNSFALKSADYTAGCVNTSLCLCDFTHLNFFSEFGDYVARVRAELGSESSSWVTSNNITLEKHTIIGPPTVTILPNGPTIEVSIKEPKFALSELRKVYSLPTYNVTYWKDGQKEKAKTIKDIQQSLVTLPKLEVHTKYCVQAQVITRNLNPNPSESSRAVCVSTTDKEKVPWVAAVVTFLVLAVAGVVVVLAVVYRNNITHFLCPKDSLPEHFKEYLLDPPHSSLYVALRDSRPAEEVYHEVSIVPHDRTVEEGCPLKAADSSCSKHPDAPAEETKVEGTGSDGEELRRSPTAQM